jgi:hypothetical membrane protein
MRAIEALRKNSFFIALAGAITFWVLLSISVYLHPGFSFFSPNQSLSDLGKIGATYPYIFNMAIILTAIMYFLAELGVLSSKLPALRKFSIYVFMAALFAYMGIALNPKGTSLHIPMTLTFFGLSSISILLWIASMFRERAYTLSFTFLILLISSFFVYFYYEFFGYPFAEVYAGAVIMIWVLTTAKITEKKEI